MLKFSYISKAKWPEPGRISLSEEAISKASGHQWLFAHAMPASYDFWVVYPESSLDGVERGGREESTFGQEPSEGMLSCSNFRCSFVDFSTPFSPSPSSPHCRPDASPKSLSDRLIWRTRHCWIYIPLTEDPSNWIKADVHGQAPIGGRKVASYRHTFPISLLEILSYNKLSVNGMFVQDQRKGVSKSCTCV